jgi:hypothetical protein
MNNKLKFTWIILLILQMVTVNFAFAVNEATNEAASGATTSLIVFDKRNKADFENLFAVKLKEEISVCKKCIWVNQTAYDNEGKANFSKFNEKLEKLEAPQIILFLFNEKLNSENQKWSEAIKKLIVKGVVVIAAAGSPRAEEESGPLRRTVFGQFPEVLIVGDLGDRERLGPSSFFGPEMLTAFRTSPKGQPPLDGMAALMTSARILKNWDKKTTEWPSALRDRRAKIKRLWPDLNDLF